MLPSDDGSFLLRGGGDVRFFSRHTETFIVRLWAEYLKQTSPTWRGEIEHVGSREVMHFGDLEEVSEQIRRCVRAQDHIHEQEEKK
jgi:hypothetical protein